MVDKTDGNSPSPATTEESGKPAEVENNTTTEQASTAEGVGTQQDGNTAESSDAGKADAKKEPERKLLDVVKDAVQPVSKDESSPSKGEKKGKDGDAESQSKKGESESDLPPFHNHPRWKEKQKEVDDLKRSNEGLKRDADQYRVVDDFMQKNNLLPSEVADGFRIMSLMKNDPKRAVGELRSYIHGIELSLGERLSDDLQQQVDDGKITEEAARELQLSRARNEQLETTVKAERQDRSAQELQNLRSSIASTITDWEKAQAKSDPDYSVKQPMVMDRVTAIVRERGRGFTSVEDAQAVAKQALDDVNARLKGVMPARNGSIRNVPAGGSKPASAEPKTLREAIQRAVAQ